ncbi:MAG: sulfotransferase [Cyanobacteria bacterium P01_F01_bin.3]
MIYPKLFIVGCPRSGTSWVNSLLAGHPDIVAVPIETHAYPLVYEPFVQFLEQGLVMRLKSWKGILRRYGFKPLLIGFHSSDIWRGILRNYQAMNKENSHGLRLLVDYDELSQLVETAELRPGVDLDKAEQLISDMFDLFFQRHGKAGQTLLEKTPLHIRYCDRILHRFPEAKVIEVIRDGRDVCASYEALAQQQDWAKVGTAGAISQWKNCIERGQRLRDNAAFSARMHTMRYESLKAEPEAELQQIFEFAELPATGQQIREFVDAASIERVASKGEGQYVRKGIVGDWKNRLSAEDVELCDAIAGKQLRALGYT